VVAPMHPAQSLSFLELPTQLLLVREARQAPVPPRAETLHLAQPLSLQREAQLAAVSMVAASLVPQGLVAQQRPAQAIRNIPEVMERLEQRHQRLTVAAAVPVLARLLAETMHLPPQPAQPQLAVPLVALVRQLRGLVLALMLLRRAVAVAVHFPPQAQAAMVGQVAPVGSG
jgi:hypothetical protein